MSFAMLKYMHSQEDYLIKHPNNVTNFTLDLHSRYIVLEGKTITSVLLANFLDEHVPKYSFDVECTSELVLIANAIRTKLHTLFTESKDIELDSLDKYGCLVSSFIMKRIDNTEEDVLYTTWYLIKYILNMIPSQSIRVTYISLYQSIILDNNLLKILHDVIPPKSLFVTDIPSTQHHQDIMSSRGYCLLSVTAIEHILQENFPEMLFSKEFLLCIRRIIVHVIIMLSYEEDIHVYKFIGDMYEDISPINNRIQMYVLDMICRALYDNLSFIGSEISLRSLISVISSSSSTTKIYDLLIRSRD